MRGLEVGVSIDDIEKQSREAGEFYKKLWSKEERERKRLAWDYIEKKREEKSLEEEQREEIEDIIEIVRSIVRKYSDSTWGRKITNVRDLQKIALDFELRVALLVKKLMLSLVLKKLTYTINPLKKISRKRMSKIDEIIKDLRRLHELGKRWANILGYPPLWLIVLEAEYLRSVGSTRLHRWLRIEIEGLELRVYLSSSRGDYLIKRTTANYPTKLVGKIGKKIVFAKRVIEKNRVPVCHAIREVVVDEVMKRYVKIVLTNKTRAREYDIQGVITCLGDKDAMELPILTTVSYILGDDGKPVKIVLTMDIVESPESDSL